MPYAFYFDSSSCSGCKACQAACKDKNNLPPGVLWRRVYEVSGGEWTNIAEQGFSPIWENTVFAFNLSMACNHCMHPKCAGVCPVDAYEVRPDGIVLINTQKCIGCGYCAWACPYDAPQMDKSAGFMTKCNLCFDYLDAGLPPACVAACPLRCLDLVEIGDTGTKKKGLRLWEIAGEEHPFPLPKLSRTEPHLVIQPHPGVKQVEEGSHVSNREETSPAQPRLTAKGEIPLILFTLLAQMAIGAFWIVFLIDWGLAGQLIAGRVTFIPLLAVGAALTLALIASFFHLGTPKNAWRLLSQVRKSWLSREILFTCAFAGFWTLYTGLILLQVGSFPLWKGLATLTALCGLAALYGMQRVYQFRSIPAWNPIVTLLEFAISALGLGSLLTAILLPRETPASLLGWIYTAGIVAFSAALLVSLSTHNPRNLLLSKWRLAFLLAGLIGVLSILIWSSATLKAVGIVVFIIALLEEAIGRWLFYARRNPGI